MKTIALFFTTLNLFLNTAAFMNNHNTENICSEIPSLGAPIYMIAHTHKLINLCLDYQNPKSIVKLFYHSAVNNRTVKGITLYTLCFEIMTDEGKTYIGIQLLGSLPGGSANIAASASAKITRFYYTKNLVSLGNVLGIASITKKVANNFKCSFMKMVYSSFGKKAKETLGKIIDNKKTKKGSFNALKILQGPTKPKKRVKKCVTRNYYFSSLMSFGKSGGSIRPENMRCLRNKNAIRSFGIGCDSNNTLETIRIWFNNANDDGFSEVVVDGRSTKVTFIDLSAAFSIRFTLYDDTYLEIVTYDQNQKILKKHTCGTPSNTFITTVVRVEDFLGFNITPFGDFGIIKYKTN